VVTLKAGEYFATSDGEVIFTVLGSCIAACLYDCKIRVGGMNHFLLPRVARKDEILSSDAGRYGMYAMELLIGELIKLGARRENLRAKLFGGSNVLGLRRLNGSLGESNIVFARQFLDLESIPIVKEDVGGENGRKIMLFSDSSKVLLKRFDVSCNSRLIEEEEAYRARVLHKQSEKPPLIIF
jgi:chemotaxis protein CheD